MAKQVRLADGSVETLPSQPLSFHVPPYSYHADRPLLVTVADVWGITHHTGFRSLALVAVDSKFMLQPWLVEAFM